MTNKMRVSLTQRGDVIQGSIELPADGTFVLECLSMVIEQMAKAHNVPVGQVVQDLYSIVNGKVV